MLLYFLLNLALVIVVAGILPVLAHAEGDESAATLARLRALQESLALAINDATTALEKQQALINEQAIPAYKKQIAAQEAELTQITRATYAHEELLKRYQEEIRILDDLGNRDTDRQKRLVTLISHTLDAAKAAETRAIALEKEIQASKGAATAAENIGSALGSITGISDAWKNSIVGSFIAAGDSGASFGQTLSTVGQKLGQQFGPLNLIGNLVGIIQERTWELAKAQDATIASVNRQTSAFGQYSDQIITINIEQRHLGIGVEEVGEAYATLHNTFTDFSRLQASTQKKLAKTAAGLEKIGVESQTTAQFLQEATKSLGMTAEQAELTTRELAGFAKELGVSVNQAMSQFAQHAKDMAKYGSAATDVFKDLAGVSKASGLEMQEMVSIAEQFTTFEGAAEAVGGLSALIGTQVVNDADLMKEAFKGPVGALKLLQEQITLGGLRPWDPDDLALNRAIAKQVGTDVATLGKIMRTNFDASASAADATAVSQETLNEMIKQTQTISEKWNNVLSSLAVSMRPVVTLVGHFVDLLSTAAGWLNKLAATGEAWAGTLSVIIGLGLVAFFGFLAVKLFAVATSMTGIASASSGVAAGITKMGVALTASSAGMASFGASALMAGAGIGLAAAGLGYLVSSFSKLAGMDVGVSLGSLAMGIARIANVGLIGAGQISALAVALAALKGALTDLDMKPFAQTITAVTKFETQIKGGKLPATTALVKQIQLYAEAEESLAMSRVAQTAAAAVQGLLGAAAGAQKVHVENMPQNISLFVEPNIELQAYIEGVVATRLGEG